MRGINCSGRRGSGVQIAPPRPYLIDSLIVDRSILSARLRQNCGTLCQNPFNTYEFFPTVILACAAIQAQSRQLNKPAPMLATFICVAVRLAQCERLGVTLADRSKNIIQDSDAGRCTRTKLKRSDGNFSGNSPKCLSP